MRAVVMIALAGCWTGCDWSLHRMQDQPKCKPYSAFDGQSCNFMPPEGVVAAEPVPAPPPLTRDLVERGRDRFERFCAPCHGVEADGASYIARVMTLRRPPSLVDPAARSLSDDRILGVIDRGYGLMPAYGVAIPPRDRFAILHFVRALQQRDVALDQLTAAQQEEARRWLQP